jgi:lipopolysaccharide/colanic/teichoic acid biosynthesis glycosyltransferase
MGKRSFDFAAALLGMVFLAPLLGGVACLIRWRDGRPILFRQARVGLDGREFALVKFRTMTVRPLSAKGSFDAGDVSRVTPNGWRLRRTKLDELPQLWNVLKGDMSLVGPRPEVRKWVEAYPERWAGVLTVRPGITDPASLIYRNEEELLAHSTDPEAYYREQILPHKLDLYESYVRTRTFAGDLNLMSRTILSLWFPRRTTRQQ